MSDLPELSDEEKGIYQWQMWVREFGEAGQRRLKASTVLVTRCGGLGSVVAYELAAAGVGKLVLAHAGNVKPSDLNRQLLMTHDAIGKPRVESAKRRLLELNPRLQVEAIGENASLSNATDLVSKVDLVVDCAPLFEERFALNQACVLQGKPLVDCAMYDLETHITTIIPGESPCLNCLYPNNPPQWRREFPVFGAVSGTVACLGAMEAIKVLGQFGDPLAGSLLIGDLRSMTFRKLRISRRPDCTICAGVS